MVSVARFGEYLAQAAMVVGGSSVLFVYTIFVSVVWLNYFVDDTSQTSGTSNTSAFYICTHINHSEPDDSGGEWNFRDWFEGVNDDSFFKLKGVYITVWALTSILTLVTSD